MRQDLKDGLEDRRIELKASKEQLVNYDAVEKSRLAKFSPCIPKLVEIAGFLLFSCEFPGTA